MCSKIWDREATSCSSEDEYIEHWKCRTAKEENRYSVFLRHFYSMWGSAKQVGVTKIEEFVYPKESNDKFAKEPTMHEKCDILYNVKAFDGFTEPIAFEIFPRQNDIVDNLDMYHVWILEAIEMPFLAFVRYPIFRIGWRRAIIDGVTYYYKKKRILTPYGKRVDVYFLRNENGQEQVWYEKQKFKDIIVGSQTQAIELIRPDCDFSKNVSILFSLPENVCLPFGLKPTTSRSTI